MSRLRYPSLSRVGRVSSADDGQVVVLILGYAAVAVLLVTVVADVARVFLVQRALHAAADGAALSAAGALDEDAAYRGRVAGRLPLDAAAARARVDAYVAAADLPGRFDDFAVVAVETTSGDVTGGDRVTAGRTGADTVTVRLASRVALPFGGAVVADSAHGYPVEVAASARSPVAGP